MRYPKYADYLELTKNNEATILKSKEAYCLFCDSRFPAKEVNDWESKGGETKAVCPRCGVPAVMGDANGKIPFTKANLDRGHMEFICSINADDEASFLSSYVDRYEHGMISTDSKEHQELYYLSLNRLAREYGDVEALISLAFNNLYGGNGFTPDPNAAWKLLKDPIAQADPFCCFLAGTAAFELAKEKKGAGFEKRTYELWSRGSALGDLLSSAALARCYLTGTHVRVDFDIFYAIMRQCYPLLFHRYLLSRRYSPVHRKMTLEAFLQANSELLYYYAHTDKPETTVTSALYHYLVVKQVIEDEFGVKIAEETDCEEQIAVLAKQLDYEKAPEIQYDYYTFMDSFGFLFKAIDFPCLAKVEIENEEAETLKVQTRFTEFAPLLVDTNGLQSAHGPMDITWTFHARLVKGELGKEAQIISFDFPEDHICFHALDPNTDQEYVVFDFEILEDKHEK